MPLDLVMVVDRSGSMSGKKLALVQEGLRFIIKQLTARDTLALVTFDDQISTLFHPTKMDADGKQTATRICTSIRPGGSTNLSGGVVQGITELAQAPCGDDSRNGSILVFTDGVANCGMTDSVSIVKCVEGCSEPINRPFSVYTFGFGDDHDADMLRAIADSGSALYYYIETAETICESFADCLGGLLSVSAQNVTLSITPHEGTRLAPISTGYKYETIASSGGYKISIGDINAEEAKDIVACLEGLGTDDLPGPTGCELELEYFDAIAAKPQRTQLSLVLHRGSAEEQCTTNMEVEAHIMRIEVAKAIEQADAHGGRGEFLLGQECLTAATALLTASSCLNPSISTLQEELRQCQSGMQSAGMYMSVGSKRMKSARNHWKQKSSRQTPQYSNNSNVMMCEMASSFVAKPQGELGETVAQVKPPSVPMQVSVPPSPQPQSNKRRHD